MGRHGVNGVHFKQEAKKTVIGRQIDRERSQRNDRTQEWSRTEKSTGVKDGQAARSVLEQSSLDDFLAQAALSRATFEAERIKGNYLEEGPRLVAITNDTAPGAAEARASAAAAAVKACASLVVPIPWRPAWSNDMGAEELSAAEGEAFLDWRRTLAQIEANEGVVMTPYERNLDFWRQLWRCVEKSDLLIQIVDARDPAFYRSRDLERYVRERFGGTKRSLLLLNKADFMSAEMRKSWAAHFAALGVEVLFFSALRELKRMGRAPGQTGGNQHRSAKAAAAAPAGEDALETVEEQGAAEAAESAADDAGIAKAVAEAVETAAEVSAEATQGVQLPPHGTFEGEDSSDVANCEQLMKEIYARLPPSQDGRRGTVGFVGYPNVGKSSVINALFGAKKVSMSRTPGKTKHLQTLELPGADLTLCDCPGLVFPSVVATKAHLAINGTVPIVELRECVQPMRVVVEKMGYAKVAAKYGLTHDMIKQGVAMLGQEAVEPARQIIAAFAASRQKFLRQKVPDETWAGKRLLSDFCSGALLHCEPPVDHGERGVGAKVAATPQVQATSSQPTAQPQAPSTEAAAAAKNDDRFDDDFSDLDAFLRGEDSSPKAKGGKKKGRR